MSEPVTSAKPAGAAAGPPALLWILIAVLVTLVLAMGNYLSFRHYARWDWTRQSIFTLSDRSARIARGLDRPVDIYVLMSTAESNFNDVKELLDRYRAASSKIVLHFVDPDRRPGEYRLLAQRFGLGAAIVEETGNTGSDVALLVVRGDKKWSVNRWDLRSLEMDEGDETGESAELSVKAEQAITGAIVQVTSGRPTKICVTTGHGEWSTEGGGERSISALVDALRRDNIELEGLETLGARRVPEGCDAVYVVGPQSPFSDAEAALLRTYVSRGGNLLLALDPILEAEAVRPTGLEGLAHEYGARVGNDLVLELDEGHLLPQGSVETFLVNDWGAHPTVRALKGLGARMVVRLSRSVRPVDGSGATVLVQTSGKAVAKVHLSELQDGNEPTAGPDALRGPVALAVASQHGGAAAAEGEDPDRARARRGGRVVVIGNASFLLAPFLQAPEIATVDFATSVTGWLAEREALVSIAPKKVKAHAVSMTDSDLSSLFFRVLVLMPSSIIILGFAVWWTRRS